MYDTNKQDDVDSSVEAVYDVWVIFKIRQPQSLAESLERMIAEAIKMIPTVGRVMVELKPNKEIDRNRDKG